MPDEPRGHTVTGLHLPEADYYLFIERAFPGMGVRFHIPLEEYQVKSLKLNTVPARQQLHSVKIYRGESKEGMEVWYKHKWSSYDYDDQIVELFVSRYEYFS